MSEERSFEVKLAKSGKVLTIPADKSIVEILYDNDNHHPISCEQGICATCIVKVLEGEPDHRDSILTDDERNVNREFTPCCSRAFSDLIVLDI